MLQQYGRKLRMHAYCCVCNYIHQSKHAVCVYVNLLSVHITRTSNMAV